MTAPDLPLALDRLEAALDRVAAAERALPPKDRDLARRHTRLRDEVARAIASLDGLVEEAEGG